MRKKCVALSPAAMGMLKQMRQAFIDKFGREPGPDDPIIFDPDADEPQSYPEEKFVAQTVEHMFAVGIDPRIIWAYVRTGLLVTETNLPPLDPEDLADWTQALDEYDEAEQHSRQ